MEKIMNANFKFIEIMTDLQEKLREDIKNFNKREEFKNDPRNYIKINYDISVPAEIKLDLNTFNIVLSQPLSNSIYY